MNIKHKKPSYIELKAFRSIDDKVAKHVAAMCSNSRWALDFLRMMRDAGYGFNIKYLMKVQETGVIGETDMVQLCRAIRYCYGIAPSPL